MVILLKVCSIIFIASNILYVNSWSGKKSTAILWENQVQMTVEAFQTIQELTNNMAEYRALRYLLIDIDSVGNDWDCGRSGSLILYLILYRKVGGD